jgi:hypothetical protein
MSTEDLLMFETNCTNRNCWSIAFPDPNKDHETFQPCTASKLAVTLSKQIMEIAHLIVDMTTTTSHLEGKEIEIRSKIRYSTKPSEPLGFRFCLSFGNLKTITHNVRFKRFTAVTIKNSVF